MRNLITAQEYCSSVFDGTHATPKPQKCGKPLVTSKHILNGKLDIANAYNISEEDYLEINKRSKVHQWDILFSMIGTIGTIYLEKSEHISYAIKNIGVFSCRHEKKARYLYYFLQTNFAKRHIQKQLAGAVQKFLSLGELRKFPVFSFDEPSYKNISILNNLDEKIELNNKISSEFEQFARTLYDYWFVQFDFPDEFGRPYKSSGGKMVYNEMLKREIPVGWEVKHVNDFLDVITGKEDANFSDPNGKYKFFTCGDDILRCDEPAFDGKSILIAGNGNFNVKYFEGQFNAYQRTYVLRPFDPQYVGIIYFSALRMIQAFTKGSSGSIVKFITKGDVEGIPVLIPHNKNLLETFNRLLDKQNHIRYENDILTEMRDFLLPMLMNGQVTINS